MTGTRWIIAIAALAAAALTARLGLWQLDRAAEKQQLQAGIEQRNALPPLPASELAREPGAALGQHYRKVALRGLWLHRYTVYLDNRQMNARPGFFVVTPLLLAPGDAVLVQRGWMPRDGLDRARLQPLPQTQSEVTVWARVAPAPSKLLELGPASTGAIRQNLDLTALASEIGLALRPLSLQQLDPPDGLHGPGDGLQRQWLKPALDVDKHHGYALQWFALCALIIGLYVWFQIIRAWHVRAQ